MEWVRERDLLIAQTLAFVQSVSDEKRDAKKPSAEPDLGPRIEAAPIDAVKTIKPPDNIQRRGFDVSRTSVTGDFRAEIQNRIANFRAHQERFHREREEYCSATLAKVRAVIGNDPARPPGK